VISVRAAVYYFRDGAWKLEDGGLSLVSIYYSAAKNVYRVEATSQVVKGKVASPKPLKHLS